MDRAALRIIDANANRATEAARVLEDAARLALNDAEAAQRCKRLRHALRRELAPFKVEERLASRDTPGDVGTRMETAAEASRGSLADVCIAAGKRLGEALRVLEEVAKTSAPAAAAEIKQLRYEGYDLEKRVVLGLSRPRKQWKLCVLITESLCTKLPWQEVARAAIRGGAECIQLREKALDDSELLRRSTQLVRLAHDMTGPDGRRADVIINDRADIAALSNADGVHLGQNDLPIHEARRILTHRMLIGLSTSRLAEAMHAIESGADYIGLGPMFPSTTKQKDSLAGIDFLNEFIEWSSGTSADGAPFPHLAISGIDAARAGSLASAGCAGVAVSSVVCSSAEPERVCREIVSSMSVIQT